MFNMRQMNKMNISSLWAKAEYWSTKANVGIRYSLITLCLASNSLDGTLAIISLGMQLYMYQKYGSVPHLWDLLSIANRGVEIQAKPDDSTELSRRKKSLTTPQHRPVCQLEKL